MRFLLHPDEAEVPTSSPSLTTKHVVGSTSSVVGGGSCIVEVSSLETLSTCNGLVVPMTVACKVRTMTFVVRCDSFSRECAAPLSSSSSAQQLQHQQPSSSETAATTTTTTQASAALMVQKSFARRGSFRSMDDISAAAAAADGMNPPVEHNANSTATDATTTTTTTTTTTAAASPILLVSTHNAVHTLSKIEWLLSHCKWTPMSPNFALHQQQEAAAAAAAAESSGGAPPPTAAAPTAPSAEGAIPAVGVDPTLEDMSFFARPCPPSSRSSSSAAAEKRETPGRTTVILQVFQRRDVMERSSSAAAETGGAKTTTTATATVCAAYPLHMSFIMPRIFDDEVLDFCYAQVQAAMTPCSSWSWSLSSRVFSLDRLHQRLVEQNTLTFQFRDVVGQAVEVLKVYTQDRVQQRLMPCKSSTFQFLVVAFMSLSLILGLQLHPQFRWMSWTKGFFFRTFPRVKKSARAAASPSATYGSSRGAQGGIQILGMVREGVASTGSPGVWGRGRGPPQAVRVLLRLPLRLCACGWVLLRR